MSAFACVVVPYFAAAAVERVEPALRERPLVVVTGTPPATRVLDANDPARACGVHPAMTEAEARARCPDLVARPLADEVAAAARHALLDAALAVSPRVEDAGAGILHVDAGGLERLVGDASAVGKRLLRELRAVGFVATVGLAESRAAARVAARLGRAVTVVEPGRERETLAGAPLGVLEPDAATTATLAQWGVRTLGELAKLPREGLGARLGAPGLRLHDLACGVDREPFQAYTAPPFYQEAQGVEWEIGTLDQLGTALVLVLDRLCSRLMIGHVAADVLDVDLRLSTGEHHHRRVALAHPLCDARAMLTLTLLDLEAHPPAAAVTAIAVTAHPVRAVAGQHGLWEPTIPRLRELATVLTRLAALAGPGSVGAPQLLDSHHPDAVALTKFDPSPSPLRSSLDRAFPQRWSLERGSLERGSLERESPGRLIRTIASPAVAAPSGVAGEPPSVRVAGERGPRTAAEGPHWGMGGARTGGAREPDRPRTDGGSPATPDGAATAGDATATTSPRAQLMLRRVRPPRAIDVEGDERPLAMRWNGVRYDVRTCAGPWRSSGAWWDVDVWARDEWDVALGDGTLCRIARDARSGAWSLDGVYD